MIQAPFINAASLEADADLHAAIRAAMPIGGAFERYLVAALQDVCFRTDPIERAEFEGQRKFISGLLMIVHNQGGENAV